MEPVTAPDLLPGPSRIPCPLHDAAQAAGDRPALVAAGRTYAFAELDARVEATATRLSDRVGAGARLGVYLPNGPEVITLLAAAWRAGVVLALISTRRPAGDVPALLEQVRTRDLVTDDADVAAACQGTHAVFGPHDLIPGPGTPLAPPGDVASVPLGRPLTLVYTSGSSGRPRAALHTMGNHVFSALGSNANIPLEPGDTWILSLPVYHVGGLAILFRCLIARATVWVPAPGEAVEEAVRAGCGTHVSMVATQFGRLLRGSGAGAPYGLKALLLGGGPVPAALVEDARARGVPVHTSYGMTEMSSQITATPPGAPPDRLATSGTLLPHRELTVAPDGELLVRGPTLFAGYVDGSGLDLPLDAQGWFHTGDRGVLEASGDLRVIGRMDRMFISGGENIQPEEIEHALMRLPDVEEAIVVSVPDADYGRRPVAFVRLERGRPEAAAIRRRLEGGLPRFMLPDTVYPWPDVTPGAGIKPSRAALQDLAERLHRSV